METDAQPEDGHTVEALEEEPGQTFITTPPSCPPITINHYSRSG